MQSKALIPTNQHSTSVSGKRCTYFGLLDDRVHVYPWRNIKVDSDLIRQELIASVMYNNPMLINDGYLVANPLVVNDICNTDSIISTMVDEGSAYTYARGGLSSITEGIEKASVHVNTHKDLVESNKWGEFKKNIDDFYSVIKSKDAIFKWPSTKNTGEIIHNLLINLSEKEAPLLGLDDAEYSYFTKAIEEYNKLITPPYNGVRSIWEHQVCEKLFKDKPKTKTRLMNLANQAYHLGMSISAFASEGMEGHDIYIQTAICPAFENFFDIQVGAGSDITIKAQDYEKFVSQNLPLMANVIITPPKIGNLSNYHFLRDFRLKSECRELRDQYTTKLDSYFAELAKCKVVDDIYDLNSSNTTEYLTRTKKEYLDYLAENIFLGIKSVGLGFDALHSVASTLLGSYVTGGMSNAMQIFINYQIGTSAPIVKRIINKFHIAQLTNEMQDQSREVIQQSNPKRYEQLMKQAGVISLKLNPQECKNFLENIQPYPSS